jgi:uncharacterized protein (DUF4415 family)
MSRVRYRQGDLPSLTEERKAELRALDAGPDSGIDYGDIPPLTDEFWLKAMRNPFYKPTKVQASVRIDADVLAWLKSRGKGYQTHLNAILREAMIRAIEPKEGTRS